MALPPRIGAHPADHVPLSGTSAARWCRIGIPPLPSRCAISPLTARHRIFPGDCGWIALHMFLTRKQVGSLIVARPDARTASLVVGDIQPRPRSSGAPLTVERMALGPNARVLLGHVARKDARVSDDRTQLVGTIPSGHGLTDVQAINPDSPARYLPGTSTTAGSTARHRRSRWTTALGPRGLRKITLR